MKDLTAKVYRTYNASNLFQKELNKISRKMDEGTIEDTLENDNNINEILDLFNKANIKVALLCNHQKKVSKSFNSISNTSSVGMISKRPLLPISSRV